MARILASCSLGGAGHWIPLADFLRASTRPDDRVLVVAPPALRDMIERDGFEYAVGDEPPEALVAPIRERLPIAPAREASVLGNRELFARLAARAMLPVVEAISAQWRPDLVLRDPCEYAAAVVAADRSIPSAQIGISLAEVEWGSLSVASPALDEHHRGLTAEIRASPYVTRFPAQLDPSPFPRTLRYRLPPRSFPPLPDWWRVRRRRPGSTDGAAPPLVYLTLGTVFPHMTFAADVYRLVLRTLAGLDARVLLTVGRAFDIDRLGELPANTHVEPWVDQDRVLAEAAVVVCHGGSGTVLGAIAAGVPIVALPSFSDQHRNSRLIERHGLGLAVGPTIDRREPTSSTELDVDGLTAAVDRVLVDRRSFSAAHTPLTASDDAPLAADVLRSMVR